MNKKDLNPEDLHDALQKQTIPQPSANREQEAIQAALNAFDVEFEKKFQGSAKPQRPISITANILTKIGEWIMNINNTQLTALSTAAVVVLIAVVVPQVQKQLPGTSEQLVERSMFKEQRVDSAVAKLPEIASKSLPQYGDKVNRDSLAVAEKVAVLPTPTVATEAKRRSVAVNNQEVALPTPQVAAKASGESAAEVHKAAAIPVPPVYMVAPPEPGMVYSSMPQIDYDVSEGGGYSGGSVVGAPALAYVPQPASPTAHVLPSFSAKVATRQMQAKRMMVQKHRTDSMLLGKRAAVGDQIASVESIAQERDSFPKADLNPVSITTEQPVSTISVDVDTASYSFVRRQLHAGRLPQPAAVRVEEMVNYFDYAYEAPTDVTKPFKPTVALYPTPWNPDTRLLHIGIKGYSTTKAVKKSNLVFLVDSSGSMHSADKLPLLKNGFKLLVDTLKPDDTVAIVVYAGSAGTVLEPTAARERHKIIAALDKLQAGGSTAGGAGIELAYSLAEANFDKDAVNRVILATDGDFNVGITDKDALKGMIERKRNSGVFLSVLGFGQGNYNDRLMQELAQNGNGIAAYIDDLNEARKVLVEEATANLFPIARDVKIQVEFNPKRIAEYRLIGYETRLLAREDFNNDAVDAGDIGAGHTVTAIYEVALTGGNGQLHAPLRYADKAMPEIKPATAGEFAFIKMRYKLPQESKSRLISRAINNSDVVAGVAEVAADLRFAAAVAAFGQKLQGGRYTGEFTMDEIITMANSAKGADLFGYRAQFVNLVRLAKALQ